MGNNDSCDSASYDPSPPDDYTSNFDRGCYEAGYDRGYDDSALGSSGDGDCVVNAIEAAIPCMTDAGRDGYENGYNDAQK